MHRTTWSAGMRTTRRVADCLGRGRVIGAREGVRLGVASAPGQDVEHRFLARHGDPVKLDPAVDHDEERRRRVPLSKQGLVRRQHDGSGARYDMRDGLRPQAAEDGDTADDLKIPARGTRGHGASHP